MSELKATKLKARINFFMNFALKISSSIEILNQSVLSSEDPR